MLDLFARNWWVLVLRGVLAIALGVLAFTWPAATLGVFLIWFGAYMLVDGLFSIVHVVVGPRGDESWWLVLLEGIAGVFIGIMTLRAPGVAAAVLLIYVAAWALTKGVLEIVAAIRLRKVIEGEFWLVLGGLASIGFAFLLLAFPLLGALSLLWVIATYAILFGVVMVLLGFRLRARGHLLAAA